MGAHGKPSGSLNSLLVKVYRLIDEGKWDDQGTGHVRIDYPEGSEDLSLIVEEEENENLIVHRISASEIYRRQEDTIISWRDSKLATDLALSFQEATGCSFIWDQISEVQRNLHFSNLAGLEIGSRPALGALEASTIMPLNDDSFHTVNSELRDLPSVELSSLPFILKIVVESGITDQLRIAELILQDQEFIPKLIDLFRMCEKVKNMDGLHMIFRLVKAIFCLNSPHVFDRIFGEEYILDIIGSLEYDPELPQVQRHRAFLKEHVVFKEAIPIKDSSVLSKIHQTYRVAYVKDVILARVLDEATIASLSSIIHANNALVISLLKDDTSFIQELFARMRSTSTSAESKRELVLFLDEFCNLSKSLQPVQQLRLFRDLAAEGIFDIVTDALQSQDRKLVSAGTDILILFLNLDPSLLRTYVIQQEANSLLGLLVEGMISNFTEDMHCQFLEIIRILVDSHNASGLQRDAIIDIFYEKHLNRLIDVLASSCPTRNNSPTILRSVTSCGGVESHAVTKPEILCNICDLLCYCVVQHPYKIKCNFLMNNAMEKVLFLTNRRERFLVVAAVRFVRTVISRNDEHLLRHIVKNNLLKPIIEAFIKNGDRYNMLHSGVLELLEYIRKENLKILVVYVVECFWEQLLKFQHLGIIQALKIKYEQCLEKSEANNTNTAADSPKRIEERTLGKEEEDYFNEDSDEDSGAQHTHNQHAHATLPNGTKVNYSSRSGSVGLVDYEDDEDDDDYNPPPRKSEPSMDNADDDGFPKIKRKSSTAVGFKDEKLLVTKKQKLEVRVNDGEAASAASTCGNHDSPCGSEPLHDSPSQLDSNGRPDEGDIGGESAIPQIHPLSDASDTGQSSRDDCPSVPRDNPSPKRVVNDKNISGSEPFSVR
ncbi:hypothetical protein MUK42_04345 [Musa troglodytarum]|uniref:Serine/threonine-protein phosphatase 4 regulatory subunit 3-like central domain-containing protein n=1 Tax=Musa troglodytarum TaxID=320322 RepID=A0A9E7HTS6_9LILI|nr:hypothetical protein MUK42_04345 [Musa troglodytarum]